MKIGLKLCTITGLLEKLNSPQLLSLLEVMLMSNFKNNTMLKQRNLSKKPRKQENKLRNSKKSKINYRKN